MPVPKLDDVKTKVRGRVLEKQLKYKKYGDKKNNVKVVEFQIGDWVRVKKPGLVVKGDRKYSDPIQIVEKISPYTYVTSDSRRWNVSKLVKGRQTDHYDPTLHFELEENDHPVIETNTDPTTPHKQLRRSDRVKQKPKWMKDYFMY